MSVSHRAPATPTATPVIVHQSTPIEVEVVPSVLGSVLRVLLGALAVLHAVTCIAVLYALYQAYQMLVALAEGLSQLRSGFGG